MSLKRPSITLIYHFFYPDDVVSARLYEDLARGLEERGWQVRVLTSNRYRSYPRKKIPHLREREENLEIIRTWRPAWNQSKNISRLLNSAWLQMGWSIEAFRRSPTDALVLGTDPQFGALLFPCLRRAWPRAILAHWCFDLYPEALGAHGVGRGMERIYRWSQKLMKWAYQSVDLMVDIGPCMRDRIKNYNLSAQKATRPPWALAEGKNLGQIDEKRRKQLFGSADLALLYSGNMGKAHHFGPFLELAEKVSQKEPSLAFAFAGRGSQFDSLKERIDRGPGNLHLAGFASREEFPRRLAAADIHLVSLKDGWQGIVVPSKFFASLAMGKPVLFAGPRDSSIAQWIEKFDVGLCLYGKNTEEVAEKLLNLARQKKKLRAWQKKAFETYHRHFSRQKALDHWNEILRRRL